MFETWTASSAAGQAAAWLLTYALHSTLFLALACLVSRRLANRWARLEEAVWRFALIAALVTASLQLAAGWEPVAGRWALNAPAASTLQASSGLDRVASLKPIDFAPAPRPVTAAPVSMPRSHPARSFSLPDARSAVLGLWALGALFLTLRWGWTYLRLRRHLRPRPEVVGGGMFALLRQLCGDLGLSPLVRLTCSSRVSVPVALGLSRPEICVPPRALSHLEPEQQQGMLAHELAHLMRRDPFWLAFSRLLAGVLFFQPLNWVACRRLREISERLCDEWAVERTGQPLSLARCLTEVASWSVRPARPLPVPSMADRPSSLSQRIRHLLDDQRSPERRIKPLWLGVAMLALLVGVAAVAPGVYAATQAEAAEPAAAAGLADAADIADVANVADVAAMADAAEPAEPAEPADPAEPDDVQLDLDLDADMDFDFDADFENAFDGDLERELERMSEHMVGAFAGLEDLAAFGDLQSLEGLSSLAQLDVLSEADAKEIERIAEESARVAEEISEKYANEYAALADSIVSSMEPEIERISEEVNRKLEPELERISEEVNRELAPEIERISERVANELEPQIEKLRAEAERLRAEGGLTDAERERLRKEAREIARQARPSEEELRAMREIQRRHREDMRKFMEQHREEIEAARRESRAHAEAMREQIRQRMESDPQLRALRERHRQEMEQFRERHREEMERHRERMRQDRERMKEHQKEMEKQKEKEKKVEKEKVPAAA